MITIHENFKQYHLLQNFKVFLHQINHALIIEKLLIYLIILPLIYIIKKIILLYNLWSSSALNNP